MPDDRAHPDSGRAAWHRICRKCDRAVVTLVEHAACPKCGEMPQTQPERLNRRLTATDVDGAVSDFVREQRKCRELARLRAERGE